MLLILLYNKHKQRPEGQPSKLSYLWLLDCFLLYHFVLATDFFLKGLLFIEQLHALKKKKLHAQKLQERSTFLE